MENLFEPISKCISILFRSGTMYFNQKFENLNIGSGQYPFLVFLFKNSGVTQEEMSSKLFIDKGTTAKALKKLEEAGYIYKKEDEKDKRAYRVYLTNEGKEITEVVFKVLHNWNDILTSGFTDEEQAFALTLLNKMIINKNNFFGKENMHA